MNTINEKVRQGLGIVKKNPENQEMETEAQSAK
jgi:hypothetical protein